MDDTVGMVPLHPARAAERAIGSAVTGLGESNLWGLSDEELVELRIDLEATLARLQGQVLRVTRDVDHRGAAVATGAVSTEAWLRGRLLQHPGAAKAEVALARELDRELPETAAALAAGKISLARAQAVAAGVRGLPTGVDVATRARGEALLAEQARSLDPQALHRLGKHLLLVLDPEHGAALEREEADRADRQQLTLVHDLDGSRSLRGRFGSVDGAFLDTVLQAMSAPRKAEDGTPDPRSAAQRRAEGLIELLKLAVGAEEAPEYGGEPIALTVSTSTEYLKQVGHASGAAGGSCCDGFHTRQAPLAPATLEDGTPLSPETTRRLACDAWLVAAIVDTDGAVLDIGRMSRVVPRPMRRALVARDGGCAFPGCGRPPRWCHAHHIWFWALGGPTKLDNLVLLCGQHHRLIHHGGWDVDIGPNNLPRFTPPVWIDPYQVPRPCWRRPDHLQLT